MTHRHPGPTYSRRAALGRFGLAALGTALGTPAALAASSGPTAHPMVGHWLAATPLGPAHVVFDREGGVLIVWPHSEDDEAGTFPYTVSATGSWQPVSDRGIHFAVAQLDTNMDRTVTGTPSLESIVVASADGGSFRSEGATQPALSGIRMWPEQPS
jgi:hypothetical protein